MKAIVYKTYGGGCKVMFSFDKCLAKHFKKQEGETTTDSRNVPCKQCNEFLYTINNPYYIPECGSCNYLQIRNSIRGNASD